MRADTPGYLKIPTIAAVELRKILPQRNRGEARDGLLKFEMLSRKAGWRNCHYAKLAADTGIAAWSNFA